MRFSIVATVAATVIALPVQAQERPAEKPANNAHAQVGAGVEYQSGDYGTGQKVERKSVVMQARATAGHFILTASLPYDRVTAPGNVVVGGGGGLLGLPIFTDPTKPATRTRREGIGDLRLGAAYVLPVPGVDLAAYGQVKLPTASAAKGLGTGKTDYAVGAELSKTIGGVTPFATINYTMPGQPDGYRLRNSLGGQAGVTARLGRRVSGQLAYGYAESLSPTLGDQQQVSSRLDVGLGHRMSLGVYGSAGLSAAAPDVTAGVQLGFSIF